MICPFFSLRFAFGLHDPLSEKVSWMAKLYQEPISDGTNKVHFFFNSFQADRKQFRSEDKRDDFSPQRETCKILQQTQLKRSRN